MKYKLLLLTALFTSFIYSQTTHQRAHELQLALACLKGYQYVQDATRRRGILLELHHALSPTHGVSWAEALDVVCTRAQLSRSQASKYHAILLQSQAFEPVNENDDRPVKHRHFRLIDGLGHSDALIRRYEQSVLHKVISRRGVVSIELIADVLGLDANTDRDYLDHILKSVCAEVDSSQKT